MCCVCRARESWRWREAWSNPWSEENSRKPGQTHSSPLSLSSCPSLLRPAVHCLVLLLSLLSIFSSHRVILSYQVSGHFSRQSRVDSASRHRVQRQLWVWKCLSLPLSFPFIVLAKQSITGNYWNLLVAFTMHWIDSADITATLACIKYLIVDRWYGKCDIRIKAGKLQKPFTFPLNRLTGHISKVEVILQFCEGRWHRQKRLS